MEDFEGYAVRRALGSGSAGSVWLARDHASGRSVVVKRVPVVAAPERFRRDLALAQGLDHLHVARLLEVRQVEREWVLVGEYGAGGTLAALLERRRGALSLGELVTLIAPVAQALTAAHRAGLTHSHLGLGDVVLTADGRPLLTDLGLRSVTGERDVAADLAALAELAVSAGGDPRVFSAGLFDGDAATVAQRVLALASPEPIDLALGNGLDEGCGMSASPGGHVPVRGTSGRRPGRVKRPSSRFHVRLPSSNLPRGVLVSVAVAIMIVVAFGFLLITHLDHQPTAADTPTAPSPTPPETNHPPTAPSTRPSTARSTPPPTALRTSVVRPPGERVSPAPASPRPPPRVAAAWLRTLRGLDVRRSDAFATVEPHKLDTVYVPGSTPWRSDRSMLASYQRRGLRVVNLRIRIDRVTITRSSERQVVLHVVDRLISGTVVDASGHQTHLPPAVPTSRVITLTRTTPPTSWRITHITAT